VRVLTLDSALAHVSVGLVEDEHVLVEHAAPALRGQSGHLTSLVRTVLDGGAWADGARCIAVTVGPGGFTGIRAALALAHGLAAGTDAPVIGVTVGEALAAAHPADGTRVWTAIDSRRGRVFLEIEGTVQGFDLDDLPRPAGPVTVLGDAAPAVSQRLAEAGIAAQAGTAWPRPLGIARAALARLRGDLPPRLAQPLYVDPPAVKLPAGGLRPAPAG
jgi:tRNA threonylcarbamoyladenosine biosynthesis protein TsaB